MTDIGRVREKRISVSPAIRLGEIEAQSFSKQKLSKTSAAAEMEGNLILNWETFC